MDLLQEAGRNCETQQACLSVDVPAKKDADDDMHVW